MYSKLPSFKKRKNLKLADTEDSNDEEMSGDLEEQCQEKLELEAKPHDEKLPASSVRERQPFSSCQCKGCSKNGHEGRDSERNL